MRGAHQQFFLEFVNDIVYIVEFRRPEDPTSAQLTYINSRVKEITGFSPEEFKKDPALWMKIVHKKDIDRTLRATLRLLKDKEPKIREYRVRTKDGVYIWVEDRVFPIIEWGKVTGIIGVARDITKRKILEEVSLLALCMDKGELLAKTALMVSEVLRADLTVIYEVEPKEGEGILRAGVGVDKRLINRYRLPLTKGTEIHYVYSSKEAVVVEDVDKEKRFSFNPDIYLLGLKSGICSPLRGARRSNGAICIYYKRPWQAREEDLKFVDSISNILGLALDKFNYEEDLKKSEERILKLNRLYKTLSVIGEIILKERDRKKLLKSLSTAIQREGGFKEVWIALPRGRGFELFSSHEPKAKPVYPLVKKKLLQKLKERQGPCAEAFLNGSLIVNNNVQEMENDFPKEELLGRGYLSFAIVPVKEDGKVVGLMGLYAGEKSFFDEEIKRLIREIGDQIGFALDFLKKEETLLKFSLAIEQTSDWVVITDRLGIIQYANKAVEKITGYSREEIIGKKTNIFKSGKHEKSFYKYMWDTILSGRTFRSIFINRRKDGKLFYLDQTITPLKDSEGNIIGFVATGKDITQEQELKSRMNYLAYYDPLTDLPNRTNFMERLSFYLDMAETSRSALAVLIMDVNRFKFVNESYGYSAGDKLLRTIGQLLRSAVRPTDTVARLGSDEFAVVLYPLKRKEEILRTVNNILSKLEDPLPANGANVRVTVGIGISVFPEDGGTPEELVKKAELALTYAKGRATSNYQFFTEELNTRMAEQMLMEKHLTRALEKGEYVLYFQPCYDLKTLKMSFAEALLRWDSEDLGLVPPSKFIPILEHTSLIVNVGEWILSEVSKRIREWNFPISVNISALQFKDEGFLDKVNRALGDAGADGSKLILEITESTLMDDVDLAVKLLKELKQRGIRVAIDDFGTGYSSLAYLKFLPLDLLKVDISFVRDIDRSETDKSIVNAIVQIARSFGLKTTAEGIEKKEHLEILKKLGCNYGQGFFFARPMPEEEFRKFLGIV